MKTLKGFVVLKTKGKGGQPLVSRLWGSGFLPGKHAGTRFRADKDAILYLNSPDGISAHARRNMLDRLKELHELQLEKTGDPGLETKIAQYEMGFRMQSSIPEVTAIDGEPESTFQLYGEMPAHPVLLPQIAYWLVGWQKRGSIQLYHPGWDQHSGLPSGIKKQCKETDRASYALVQDLKQRGMLKDTLVIWGGEFGHPGIVEKFNGNFLERSSSEEFFPGLPEVESNRALLTAVLMIVLRRGRKRSTYHDFHATILHMLGIDHERLAFETRALEVDDVHGHVVKSIVS